MRLTVEDSFRIAGRGIVLAPSVELDRFASGARLSVEVRTPSGESWTSSGRFLLERVRLFDGRSEWAGVVVLDESTRDVPSGSTVVVSLLADG